MEKKCAGTDNMALVVGDSPCSYGIVCDLLGSSKSSTILWSKLVDISRSLGVPEDRSIMITQWLVSATKTHNTVLYEILEAWRGKEGCGAKLSVLLSVLEKHDLKDCSETLRQQFNTLEGITECTNWDHLSHSQKCEIKNKQVLFQGKPVKLDTFRDLDGIDGRMLLEIANGNTPTLIINQVPAPLEYCIPRTIKSRSKLMPEVFQSRTNDVFVIQGIRRPDLTILAGGHQTDDSKNQIRQLTVRFILLEYEPDFEKICDLTPEPVHWIRVTNQTYEWIKSSGSIETLQQHVHPHQETISVDKIDIKINRINILSDSPGMGKTVLLSMITEEIHKVDSLALVRFIVMKEFVQAMNRKAINMDSISSLISYQSSEFEYGQRMLQTAIKSGDCILMFDGFDEVLIHQIPQAKQILQAVANSESARMFVTARPHMREELENALNVLGHTIEPFNETDQINFLVRFWASRGVVSNEHVEQFAKSCLNSLSINMKDYEREITGIPLQCRMLAETYAEEAERCSKLGCLTYQSPHSPISATSIFEVYERHVRMRFERLRKTSDEQSLGRSLLRYLFKNKTQYEEIKHAHMYYALELLFPEETSKFKQLKNSTTSVSLNDLCAFGILEATQSNGIRFVHRTFAEYLVAWFVVDEEFSKIFMEFKVSRILGTTTKPNGESLYVPFFYSRDRRNIRSIQFNFPVVCYFINEFTKHQPLPDSQLNQILPLLHSNLYNKISSIVFASAFHNHPYVMLAVHRLFRNKQKQHGNENSDIGDLLLITAKYSDLELMKTFCQEVDMTKIKFRTEEIFATQLMITPLHMALRRGHYNLVEYLVNKLDAVLPTLRYLFHFCVTESIRDNDATLGYKKQIIQLLMKKSKQWLDETVEHLTPILQSRVHFEMMECLIEEGADVNVCDNIKETILHKIIKNDVSPESYHRIIKRLCMGGFRHFNMRNDGYTKSPIHYAVKKVELLEETIGILYSNGANLNALTGNNDSVLFYAIQGKRSVKLLQSLIHYGADIHNKNKQNKNVLHISAEYENYGALLYFVDTHKMSINVVDDRLETPLHKAGKKTSEDCHKIQNLLIANGADVNAMNMDCHTPLMHAFLHGGLGLDIIKLMEAHGLKVSTSMYSDLLKISICNRRIDVDKFADVFVYLLERKGTFNSDVEWNPWNLEGIQRNLPDIALATDVTSDVLRESATHKLLSLDELREIEQTPALHTSINYYKIVAKKPNLFEDFLKVLIFTNQLSAFQKIKAQLSEHLQHELSVQLGPLPEDWEVN